MGGGGVVFSTGHEQRISPTGDFIIIAGLQHVDFAGPYHDVTRSHCITRSDLAGENPLEVVPHQ